MSFEALADLIQIPPGQDHIRPDFMAPGHNLVINELGATELAELEEENPNDPDSLSALDPRKARLVCKLRVSFKR